MDIFSPQFFLTICLFAIYIYFTKSEVFECQYSPTCIQSFNFWTGRGQEWLFNEEILKNPNDVIFNVSLSISGPNILTLNIMIVVNTLILIHSKRLHYKVYINIKNINKCFCWKTYLTLEIEKLLKTNFISDTSIYFKNRLIQSKWDNSSKTGKGNLLGHIPLLHTDT